MTAVTQQAAPDASLRRRQAFWVVASTVLASSMGFIEGSALNVVLPRLQTALSATGADVLWVTNGYLLVLSALILVGGALGDRYGRKRVFGLGIVLFAVASALCGFAPNVTTLIGARLLQGVGGALMIPGSLAIISAFFDDPVERGAAIGTWSALGSATTVAGPLLGGALAAAGFWRGVFFIVVPLAGIALWGLWRYVPESRDENAPANLDWLGAALAVGALAALTYGFIQLGEAGPTARNIAALVGGLVLSGVFVAWEARAAHPMMPLSLFRSPVFAGANALTLLLYAGLIGALFFLSLNLIQIQGYNELYAGLATLPFGVLVVLLSRRLGAWSGRVGPRLPLTIGALVVAAGFALLAVPGVTRGPAAYWWTYFPAVVLVGLGMSFVIAPLSAAVMGAVARNQAGIASGINNAASRVAGTLAIAVFGGAALLLFSNALAQASAAAGLDATAQGALLARAAQFGGLQVEQAVAPGAVEAARAAVDSAFVSAFRVVVLASATLAALSGGLAWLMLGGKHRPA